MYAGIEKYRPSSPPFFLEYRPYLALGRSPQVYFRPEHLLWLTGLLGCHAVEKLLTSCPKRFPEFSQFRTGFGPLLVRR